MATLPPILQLPTEILTKIISPVVPSLRSWEFELIGLYPTSLAESPFHNVRATCRTFRWIVDELPFWIKDTFDISAIEHLRRDKDWDKFRYSAVLPSDNTAVLLSDAHLRQCLSRKTGWYIASPPLFETISTAIPRFGQSLRCLYLSSGERAHSWVHVTSVLSNLCPMLAVLIVWSTAHIHLDNLPPTLESLDIHEPFVPDCHCRNNLPNLDKLLYYRLDPENSLLDETVNLQRILPSNSKKTLRQFALGMQTLDPDRPLPFTLSQLDQFEKLTSLTLRGSDAAIFRSLAQSSLRLKTFLTSAADEIHVYYQAFLDLLKSPVVRDLETLEFDVIREELYVTPEEGRHKFESLIREIARLPALESLVLDYPLHIDWFTHFRESRCLKSISWMYSYVELEQKTDGYEDEDLETALRRILPRSGDDVEVYCEYVGVDESQEDQADAYDDYDPFPDEFDPVFEGGGPWQDEYGDWY